MNSGRVYLEGGFFDAEEARVPVDDRGFLYGDALFETLRSYNARPFMLERHLDRMFSSCRELGIRPRESRSELAAVVGELIAQVAPDAYLRIAVTRGSGFGPWPRIEPENGRTVIVARPLVGYTRELYDRGIKLVTSAVPRAHRSPLARHKTANYMESVLARREAAGKGADEALLLNTAGRVAELSAANIFAVSGGEVITPEVGEGALPGVTRGLILELAAAAGIVTREVRLESEDLARASEVFATNSILEICPVTEFDGTPLGAGMHEPGPLTARLRSAYSEEVNRLCPR
jgi:branched-chain amino acid aminotransferase